MELTTIRPAIPVDALVCSIIADAATADRPHGEQLAEVASLGANALLPGAPTAWPDVPGSDIPEGQDFMVRRIVPNGPDFTPKRVRSFRPVLRMEDGDVVRLAYIPRVLGRHPKEGFYLCLAIGWYLMEEADLAPEVAATAKNLFGWELREDGRRGGRGAGR